MAFSNGYTIGFAFTVCIICSTALASVSMGLKETQDDNRRRDLYKNILSAVDLPEQVNGARPALSGPDIDKLWADKIELQAIDPATGAPLDASKADLDGNGTFDFRDLKVANDKVRKSGATPEILGVYIRKDTGTVAMPMVGKGLWGPISAYIAFDPKIEKVVGTTFFAPKETPGLGAEITNPAFMSQWPGKSVVEGGKTTAIRVTKPAECEEQTNPHCVDGVSGATITSRGVDQMVAKSLALYEPYIQKVRQ
ncbi:MAG: NADH:ubiquinone reductase (Na(+)-transporting) subunit C [Alphaproteobacteria bacterium]|nr:NADH:ubiquinone reductase (Na(+)-transporting) subunit C [Alphaproteobacteria bacterium]